MVEAGHFLVLGGLAVPHEHFARQAARRHQVVIFFTEFALHQVLAEVFALRDGDLSVLIYFPDASKLV